MYLRVIPRDLFNESKLLKCLGKLALSIHEGCIPDLTLEHCTEESEGFVIDQNPSDGTLFCANLELTYKGNVIHVATKYNCKDNYPLIFEMEINGDYFDGYVFDDNGKFTKEFQDMLKAF